MMVKKNKNIRFPATGIRWLLGMVAFVTTFVVKAQPAWTPPGNMQYNMQVVGRLQLSGGNFSTNGNDMVAAFVGGELRGVASPLSSAEGRIFLTILSNQVSGETVSFKAWISSSAQIVDLNETIAFTSQGEAGTYNNPFIFTVVQGPVSFTIQASAGTGGSISPSGTVTVPQGGSQTFSIAPSAGYQIQDVLVNGQSVGALSSYTFTNVQSNHTIHATFSQMHYTITATAAVGGNINPSGTVSVPHGGSQSFSISPNQGYSIQDVLVDGQSVGPVSSYTFQQVTGNRSIHALFAAQQYTLTYQAGQGGSISGNAVQTVPHGGSGSPVTAVPNSGYSFVQWSDGRTDNPRQDVNVTANITVTANFTSLNVPPGWQPPVNMQYNMQVVARLQHPGGMYSTNSTDLVAAFVGSEVRGMASPLQGQDGRIFLTISSNEAQGESVTFKAWLSSTAHVVNLNENLSFSNQAQVGNWLQPFTFTYNLNPPPPQFSITATAGTGGSISLSGVVNVTQGANQTFTITPNAGYLIADVLVNGQSVGALSSYTFTNVQGNQSIHATFTQITFTITATAGAGGSISPSGAVVVPQGGSQTFSIIPNAGYLIADVLVNGQSVGALSSYTFTNVQSNQSIHATFTQITYTISASAGAGGGISPSGAVVVPQGGSQTFTITPNAGYLIDDVLVNGQSVGAVSSYTFTNVQSNQSIHATFIQITYTITATAGAGGSISPSGAVVVPQGGSQTFSITPSAGYLIADVLVNGQSVGAVNSYTFTNVQSNQSIHATFSQITYTITATAGAGGGISPSGAVVVPQGGSQTFSITPSAGYLIADVLVNGQSVGAVSSYNFTNVQGNQSIHATFTQITYTITASAGPGGGISPSGAVVVPQGGIQTFSITPNAGYFIADVLVNGQSVGALSSYTFTNVQGNQSIHATFTQITYTITATAGTGGSNSPSGAVVVPQGGSQTFSITPSAGYFISDVLVNGQSLGAVSSYTFTNVQSNQSIHATFSQITYTITATAGAGGSISPSGAVVVPQGGSQTFSITPSAGYFISDVLVNGQSLGAVSSYTFTNVQSNQSIHATFSQITYTITATAGAGGSISPSGIVVVPQGGNQTFTITPNAGYLIADVLVNGQSVGAVSSYTFTNVQSNLSIHATFTQITYTISASAGTGGSISPSGAVVVPQGGNQTFSITPNAGYFIADVLVNGQSVGAVSSYTFTNVQSNLSIHATFTQITYTVSASAGTGGSISPSGAVVVPQGGNQTFTITPNAGYVIANVLVNGQSVGAVSSYTFTNVQSNQSIHATFTQITFTITASAGTGGSISPSGAVVVLQGGSQTFSITPNAGYVIANVLVNDQSVGAVSSYTFTNVQSNQSIHATFTQITYTISASAGTGGSISPSGVVTVPYMGSQTFTITPSTGFIIATVLVNGQSVGAVSSYTFNNVVSNHQIYAVFTPATYTITASAGPGGSISPSGTFIVNHGSSITFSIQPNAGYRIDSVVVDGQNVGSVNTWQLQQISANHSIAAWFGLITGINENNDSQIIAFPNPGNGQITLRRSKAEPAVWQLFDAHGRLTSSGRLDASNENRLNVTVKPGNYQLLIREQSGTMSEVGIIVK